MARYLFRCRVHGLTEASYPMGAAALVRPCPACGGPATRAYCSPALARPQRAAVALAEAKERAEASATSPQLVTALPPGPKSRPAAPGPDRLARWLRLPRPY